MVANKFNKLNRFEIDRAIMEFPRITCYKCDIFQFHNFLEMKPISWYLSLWVLSLSCQVEKSHLTHNFIWIEESSFPFPWLSATDLQRASGAIMAYHPAQHIWHYWSSSQHPGRGDRWKLILPAKQSRSKFGHVLLLGLASKVDYGNWISLSDDCQISVIFRLLFIRPPPLGHSWKIIILIGSSLHGHMLD